MLGIVSYDEKHHQNWLNIDFNKFKKGLKRKFSIIWKIKEYFALRQ